MKNPILRNGIYAAIIVVVLPSISFFLNRGEEMDYGKEEFWGYLILLFSMIFVFLGMRQYRDQENGGRLTFTEGLKVGAMIVAIPSLAFGLYNVFYVIWLDPGFMDNYFQYNLDQLRAELPPAEYAIQEKDLLSQKALFMNPLVNFAAMFFTVFLMGFIVSIISSFILRRSEMED